MRGRAWACGWGVQASFDTDLGLVRGDGWLGQLGGASHSMDLTRSGQINAENGGGRGISGREKEKRKGKEGEKEKRNLTSLGF